MVESEALPEEDAEPAARAYRPPQPQRMAQHKFLMLGVVLALIIVGVLVWLNKYVKQENNFQEALDVAERSHTHQVNGHSAGLAYQPTPPAPPPGNLKPVKIAPGVPTIPAPADESPAPPDAH